MGRELGTTQGLQETLMKLRALIFFVCLAGGSAFGQPRPEAPTPENGELEQFLITFLKEADLPNRKDVNERLKLVASSETRPVSIWDAASNVFDFFFQRVEFLGATSNRSALRDVKIDYRASGVPPFASTNLRFKTTDPGSCVELYRIESALMATDATLPSHLVETYGRSRFTRRSFDVVGRTRLRITLAATDRGCVSSITIVTRE